MFFVAVHSNNIIELFQANKLKGTTYETAGYVLNELPFPIKCLTIFHPLG